MEYFLLKPDGEQTGTYSMEQVQAMLRTGFIGPDTRYWHEGVSTWEPVDKIEQSLKFSQPPPAPASTTAPVRRMPAYSRIVPPGGPKPVKTAAAPLPLADAVPPREEKKSAFLPPPLSPGNGNGHSAGVVNSPAALSEFPPSASLPPAGQPPGNTQVIWGLSAMRIAAFFLYALPVVGLAVGIVYGVANIPQGDHRPQFRMITLNNSDNYALVEQGAIRPFEDDLRDSATLDSLTRQIADTTNPSVLDRLNMGLVKERIRHDEEVRQDYLGKNKAKLVEPGTYRILGDFNEAGSFSLPQDGDHWLAIFYRGSTVYVHGAPDPPPAR